MRYLSDRVAGLTSLQNSLSKNGISEEVMALAIERNPWFTPYYIKHSLSQLLPWLNKDTLSPFLKPYREKIVERSSARVGIIMAGNLPFVGFHDVLMGVLSGNELYLSYSHQDEVLMKWLINSWKREDAMIEAHIHDTLSSEMELDFLLATGSNNTSRYIQDTYQNMPRLVRQNRFSVAMIDDFITDEQLNKLSKDILLYNGLGCRNVSNVIVTLDFDHKRLLKALSTYPVIHINPLFLEKLAFERVRMNMMGQEYIDAGTCLLTYATELKSMPMGLVNVIRVKGKASLETLLAGNVRKIQCLVNKGTEFGATQCPTISDFADGIHTLEVLTEV